MKKDFFRKTNTEVKVAKLKNNTSGKGVVVFIALLLVTNLLISLKILLGYYFF